MFVIPASVDQTGPNSGIVVGLTPAWVHLVATKPLIAWLVYRGVLESVEVGANQEFMSLWAVSMSRSSSIEELRWKYLREKRLELARLIFNPSAVSRMAGFFAFADRPSMARAVADPVWGFQDHFVQEVELRPGSHVSWHDTGWLATVARDEEQAGFAASQYALGEQHSDDPHWELLVAGKANLVGTELRERAYRVVKDKWPDSLAALEIARLAAWVDDSTGYIAARPALSGEVVRIEWFMKFPTDKESERQLIELLKDIPAHHRNQPDLRAANEADWFRVPDLRPQSLEIPISAWPWRRPGL